MELDKTIHISYSYNQCSPFTTHPVIPEEKGDHT